MKFEEVFGKKWAEERAKRSGGKISRRGIERERVNMDPVSVETPM